MASGYRPVAGTWWPPEQAGGLAAEVVGARGAWRLAGLAGGFVVARVGVEEASDEPMSGCTCPIDKRSGLPGVGVDEGGVGVEARGLASGGLVGTCDTGNLVVKTVVGHVGPHRRRVGGLAAEGWWVPAAHGVWTGRWWGRGGRVGVEARGLAGRVGSARGGVG